MAPKKKYPNPVIKTCENCGKEFECKRVYQIEKQRYCSRSCNTKSQGLMRERETVKIDRNCKTCGAPMKVLPCRKDTHFYCSYTCRSAGVPKGPENWAWEGGTSRTSNYYKEQVKKARRRDNHTCQRCWKKPEKRKNLHVHHLVPMALYNADKTADPHILENLTCLCNKCHQTVESKFYRLILDMLGVVNSNDGFASLREKAKSTLREGMN